MNTKDILLEFLNFSLDSADGIFEKFSSLPNAKIYRGNNPGERFLFIEGKRPDAAVLVSHADTVFNVSGSHKLIEDGDIIRSGSTDYGIGADDRAGCAMLWLLKDLGHHVLICDYEESSHYDAIGCCTGSKYLMREYRNIAQIIDLSSCILEFDRRLAFQVDRNHYTSYDIPVTKEFRDFIETSTHFIDNDHKGFTDVNILCKEVCGANICVGYAHAHSPNETISISAFQNTYEKMLKMLSGELKRYALEGKEGNQFFPPQRTPYWLQQIAYLYHEGQDGILQETKARIKEKMRNVDFCDILKDSLYYSACGNDIAPIIFFEKNTHSFVYCLDLKYNMGYDSEFESIKTQLKDKKFKKRVNIDLKIDYFRKNNWSFDDEELMKKDSQFKANWSIWEHENDFFSLLFIACDSYTTWKNLYKNNHAHPKIFHFQGFATMFGKARGPWIGGFGKDEGGKFIVNSEYYCDGTQVYRNEDFIP